MVKDTRDVADAQVYVLTETPSGGVAQTYTEDDPSKSLTGEYGKSYTYSVKACFGDGSDTDATCKGADG